MTNPLAFLDWTCYKNFFLFLVCFFPRVLSLLLFLFFFVFCFGCVFFFFLAAFFSLFCRHCLHVFVFSCWSSFGGLLLTCVFVSCRLFRLVCVSCCALLFSTCYLGFFHSGPGSSFWSLFMTRFFTCACSFSFFSSSGVVGFCWWCWTVCLLLIDLLVLLIFTVCFFFLTLLVFYLSPVRSQLSFRGTFFNGTS